MIGFPKKPQTPVNVISQDNSPKESIQIENEDLQKWEMEIAQMIDKKVMELQGMVLDFKTGEWIRHPFKKRIMNEYGAWEFKQEINSRVFLNMQMSDLEDRWIICTCARAGMIFADKLADNFREWEVEPLESNFESICQQLHDMIYICLMIAKNQGMRKHREKRGISRHIEQPVQQGGAF